MKHHQDFAQIVHNILVEFREFSPNIGIGIASTGIGSWYSVEIIHKSFDLALSFVSMIALSVGSFVVKELMNRWKIKRALKKKQKEEEEIKKRQDNINVIF